MRSILLATALCLAPACVHAECKDEVLAALDRQRKSKAFRMETSMISEAGPVAMAIELIPPGRMHQVVTTKIDNRTTETIVVGLKAWSRADGGWEELSNETASMMSHELADIMGDDPGTIGTVACLGSTTVEGRPLMVYRIENDGLVEEDGVKEVGKAAKEKAASALADENRPIRMFYVDPATGLPARSLFARASKLDKPISKAEYTYPDSLSIEPPPAK